MPKPIAVIYFPPTQEMDYNDAARSLAEHYYDYYWFCLPDPNTDKIYFEVFHDKDYTKYEELKCKLTELYGKLTVK